ncbi:MAG: HAD-IA family hydrolase [Alphaproteobacteria bacterium]|nr:HAD-IA family hydrolase [Alphaproteobacteria bacterium]
MEVKFRPKAILFDLDGTLVDTATDIVSALDQLLIEFGRQPVGQNAGRGMIGDGARALVARGFAATGGAHEQPENAFKRWLEIYSSAVARHSLPYPGVPETLSDLANRGIALAVCTNKADSATRLLLEALDLSRYFRAVVGGDIEFRKPDPRHIFATLELLGVAPAQALMVGDSANDANAARSAGLDLALVEYGYTDIPAADLSPDALLSEFAQLREIVG